VPKGWGGKPFLQGTERPAKGKKVVANKRVAPTCGTILIPRLKNKRNNDERYTAGGVVQGKKAAKKHMGRGDSTA